jgi:hypothetical protein
MIPFGTEILAIWTFYWMDTVESMCRRPIKEAFGVVVNFLENVFGDMLS